MAKASLGLFRKLHSLDDAATFRQGGANQLIFASLRCGRVLLTMKAARSGIVRPNTSAKVGKSRRNRSRARRLTGRQEKFLRLITTPPIPSLARAAREARYSESVARKPKIICESRAVLEAWNRWWNTAFKA